jgi:MoaA/NifB/PqqE/SkfB family radical SAM enzyme
MSKMKLLGRIARLVAPPDLDLGGRFALWRLRVVMFLKPPDYEGVRLTLRRLLNLYLLRVEMAFLRSKLWSYPVKLTVEPTNVCNLACPACFTGDGQVGRARRAMSFELYTRLLDEVGDRVMQIEFCNWGEPLLARQLCEMIEAASRRGIATLISTNFSVPFDAARAERLVASGLAVLGVSIDGAEQATYEQYRVGGNLETVLKNCRLVIEAKQRLRSMTPRMIWSFHVFSHNVQDVDRARAMARELGMDISVEKGWTVGSEWDRGGDLQFTSGPVRPFPCLFLWHSAVVNNDGGVSPCCGTFYREDDMGQLSLGEGTAGASTFREVWNGPRFQQARRFYRSRTASSESEKAICYDCPVTVVWDQYKAHLTAGLEPLAFDSGRTAHDNFNFFWNRRPPGAQPGSARPGRIPRLEQ